MSGGHPDGGSGRREFVSVRTLADRYEVSERTVRRWIADGTVASVKIGGSRRVIVEWDEEYSPFNDQADSDAK